MNLGENIRYIIFYSFSFPNKNIQKNSFYYSIQDKVLGRLDMATAKDVYMQIFRGVEYYETINK